MNDERARQARHRLREAVVADRGEVARLRRRRRREHQRHAIDDQRLDDARDQPLAEADDVEVAVQVAREGDERAAVVVAIAIEHAVERVLHRLLHRLRQQHDDQRREQRDDPVVLVGVAGEDEAGQLAQRRHRARRWRPRNAV